MPPKKAAGGPSKKTEAKKKEKIIEVGKLAMFESFMGNLTIELGEDN